MTDNLKIDKFRDPIHGFIEVNEYERKIIDSPSFQRLRNIKQLALTSYVFHGAEHTRFGHSIGVMHLVTRAFEFAIQDYNKFSNSKKEWYKQILRLIALTHDLGHAPFSHASESVFPEPYEHEDYTVAIVQNTEIAQFINELGDYYVNKYGPEYNITPNLICEIYLGKNPGENNEFTFLKTFMDSELDCDKMDYLLRDSHYCGVNYGTYDIERLLSSFTIYDDNGQTPRLAIKDGGIQAFEEFVLARYFMFIQIYFHRTRRFFDIMLENALKHILPNKTYPDPQNITEYLQWDDCKVIELIKKESKNNTYCKNIINRIVYPMVFQTKTHPQEQDTREFRRNYNELQNRIGEGHFIKDCSASKMPHKIPQRVEKDDEKAIVIYNKALNRITTISEESEIINNLTKKIDIERIYCTPECKDKAYEYIKTVNSY